MTLLPWKILSSKIVFQDTPWVTVRADRCETMDGVIVDPYYVQEALDWAQVVAFDQHDNILITRQYRHGSQLIEMEIPCGNIEAGESPLIAMQRELLEETGCAAETYIPLPVVSPNPSRHANKLFSFIALETRYVAPQKLDQNEDIEFEFIPISKLLSFIDKGEFAHPLHVASVFMALRRRGML